MDMSNRRRVGRTSVLLLALASGCALAQVGIENPRPFGDGGISVPAGSRITLSAEQQELLRHAFAWSSRDASILPASMGAKKGENLINPKASRIPALVVQPIRCKEKADRTCIPI